MAASSSRRKRRSSPTFLATKLVVICLCILVSIMVVANIVVLWPLHHSKTNTALLTPNDALLPKQQQQQQHYPIKEPPNYNPNKIKKGSENKIVEIFRQAGVELTEQEIQDLPSWENIVALIGNKPVVYGLETCEAFRNTIPPVERNLGAAGMFNTGTNLVTLLLKHNCKIPERVEKYGIEASKEAHGIRWQVSWGKHTPAHFKWDHATNHSKNIQKETILPIVTIRDPYKWMASMCRNPYTAKWKHNNPQNCPNLVERRNAGRVERSSQPNRVNVTYAEKRTSSHSSLAHLWNDWYTEYLLQADYPRLVVRFEDLIFFPLEMTTTICECAGGTVQLPFTYIVNPAKTGPGHGAKKKRTGMIQAWLNYGKPPQPQGGFSKSDYDASKEYLNQEIMQTFGYSHPPSIEI